MLLGCCHCDEPTSSSSTPSSGSSSGSSSTIGTVIRTTCSPNVHACINDEAPLIFNVSVTDLSGSHPCYPFYVGDFLCYLGPNPTVCWSYFSTEWPVDRDSSCALVTGGNSRWQVSLLKVGANLWVTCGCLIKTGGFVVSLATWLGVFGATPHDCVRSFTLTKTSVDPAGFPFPTTITVTPA